MLGVTGVSISEGDSGSTPLTFTVTLSPASSQTVTVNFATAGGTATSGTDFAPASGTLTFVPGETGKTVAVQVNGDLLDEADETLTLALSAPVNATLGTTSAVGTIVDNDPTPTVGIGDVTLAEGQTGTTAATFAVTLSAPSGRTVTVGFATADGSAVAPGDYAAVSGVVTFAAGETSKPVTVLVNGDIAVEPNETWTVALSAPSNATIADGTGLGTIINDDSPALSITPAVSVTEGHSGTTPATFTVTLSVAAATTVTVNYATASGTAASGTDFTAAAGTLTFLAGETSKTVIVNVVGETLFEANETFTVVLSGPVGGDDRRRHGHRDDHQRRRRADAEHQQRDRDRGQRRHHAGDLHRHAGAGAASGGLGHLRDGQRHGHGRQRLHRRRLHGADLPGRARPACR